MTHTAKNRIKGKLKLGALMIFAALLSLSSCRHKDIDFEDFPMQGVDIAFDWSNAPDADPTSMAVFLFYNPTESPDSTLRYDFQNKTGGSVRIPFGSFSGLAFSSDNTDWAHFRNTESIEDFEIYTREVVRLPKSGLGTRGIPKAREAEEETMVECPQKIWSGRNDLMQLKKGESRKTFTFYPEELTCHYTVDIYDIENLNAIDGTAVDATLSGMSGSYMQGKKAASDTRHTIPFLLTKKDSENSLHAEFLTFGESPLSKNPHKLGVYLVMNDENKYFYSFDVGNQIYEATDPKHVHIVIHGLSLPVPITGGSGFAPDVNDWETVERDITM